MIFFTFCDLSFNNQKGVLMKKMVFSLLVFSVLIASISNKPLIAQNQSSRFSKQHKSHFLKEHLKQTEEMLIQALQSGLPSMRSTAAQTTRELEQIFPSEKFTSLISPLCQIVSDENADIQSRVLSALALDGLHSDEGDKVIFNVAKTTSIEPLKVICDAMARESFKAEEKISLK